MEKRRRPLGQWLLWGGVVVVFALLGVGLGLLLSNIEQRRLEGEMFPARIVEMASDELDPAVWGLNFPRQYDSFRRTEINYGRTPYGGSEPWDKLEKYPFLRTFWAGLAFSVDYNEERGHYYAQIDQRETLRTQQFNQPGACISCHAAEAPLLIAELGWETFNRTPYNDLAHRLHLGTSCADCHTPNTMELRITRPALVNALEVMGVDLAQASRQEMRSYVCAQCHVEYYFLGPDRLLTFPWSRGLSIEAIEEHYDAYAFSDWTHAVTKAPMVKIQHPEFELWSSGIHARSGVSCADCHMPYTREGGVKVSDHWTRSPLTNLNNSCQTCHRIPEDELYARVITIQERTYGLLRLAEAGIGELIELIAQRMADGVPDEALAEARTLHRRAQMRWDFIFSENSMGFHSSQESARVLAQAIDFARQGVLAAERAGR
jgi:nitrite reductase (cytochrome c-552)